MKKRIEKPRHRPYDRVDHKHTTALLVTEELVLESWPASTANDRTALAGGLFAVSASEWAQWQQTHGGGDS